MTISALWDILLSNNVLLYLGIVLDGFMSFFLYKKAKKKNSLDSSQSDTVSQDIQSLIDYHKTVAAKLEEKIKKEEK